MLATGCGLRVLASDRGVQSPDSPQLKHVDCFGLDVFFFFHVSLWTLEVARVRNSVHDGHWPFFIELSAGELRLPDADRFTVDAISIFKYIVDCLRFPPL